MTNIRLLPVVVLAIAALLVFKTIGLVTNGGYVLTGVGQAIASGAAPAGGGEGEGAAGGEATMTMPSDHTIEDIAPTAADTSPTLAPAAAEGGGHSPSPAAAEHTAEPTDGEAAPADDHAAPEASLAQLVGNGTYCVESNASIGADGTVVMNGVAAEGEGGSAPSEGGGGEHGADAAATTDGHAETAAPAGAAVAVADCLPTGDAVPLLIDGKGGSVPLVSTDGGSATEKLLLERLAARRAELQKYEDDLALRSQIVDAAEKRIEERSATLSALETQISTLVDQRTEMESGQFAGIVAMYETMKPKDAANIFNNLDMDVLLRVAKTMSPRKMAPILAVMDTQRAQELTVKMANLADQPATEMTPADLAALPQIVGQ